LKTTFQVVSILIGFEYCTNLLQHKKVESDDNLRFYILMRLYECSILDGKYGRAVDYLDKAQKIKPSDILANYWTAEANELIGNAEKAIRTYQDIVANITPISDSLRGYLNKQIERVKTKGPKSPSPMPGLKYMSY
jgi:tetratricopeptide (TPR) repeat protein